MTKVFRLIMWLSKLLLNVSNRLAFYVEMKMWEIGQREIGFPKEWFEEE